jgi:hypothetical protein
MIGLSLLQPNKVNIKDISDADWSNALKLLKAMDEEFSQLAEEMKTLYEAALTFSMTYIQNQQNISSSKNAKFKLGNKRGGIGGESGGGGRSNNKNSKIVKSHSTFPTPYILNDQAILLLNEFHHCFDILSLRAKQIYALYLSFDPVASPTSSEKANLQKISRQYINQGKILTVFELYTYFLCIYNLYCY